MDQIYADERQCRTIIVGALSCSEGIATRLSDKGMASAEYGIANGGRCELKPGQIGAQFNFRGHGPRHGAALTQTILGQNTASYDIAKLSYT